MSDGVNLQSGYNRKNKRQHYKLYKNYEQVSDRVAIQKRDSLVKAIDLIMTEKIKHQVRWMGDQTLAYTVPIN